MSSDTDDEIVIPVPDHLSDGTEAAWPQADRHKYAQKDDYSWRTDLAEKLVKEQGAYESGKFSVHNASFISALQYLHRALWRLYEDRIFFSFSF